MLFSGADPGLDLIKLHTSDRQASANSVGPDQTSQNAVSDQGLPVYHSSSSFTLIHR